MTGEWGISAFVKIWSWSWLPTSSRAWVSRGAKTPLLNKFRKYETFTFTDGFPGYGGSRTLTVLRNSCPAGHFYRLTPKCPHFYPTRPPCSHALCSMSTMSALTRGAAAADLWCQGGNAATAIERVVKVGLIATVANGGAVIGEATFHGSPPSRTKRCGITPINANS